MTAGDHEDYDSSILEAWQPMILGAVDADARCHDLSPVTPGEFWYWPGLSCWIDRQGMVTSVAGEPTNEGSLNGFDPKASWLKWSTEIPQLWTRWQHSLPDPADLEPAREAIYQAASQLALDPEQHGYGTDATAQAAEFSHFVQVLTGEVGGMGGAAMISFNHEIASRIPYTSQSQAAAALVAAYAVQAEQAAWKATQEFLDKTVKQAVQAFEGAYPGGHGGGDLGWIGVVSAVSGALALVPSPASPFLGTVSGVAGSLATFADYLGSDTEALPLGGDSPQEVCDNVEKALSDLDDSLTRAENAISRGCAAAQSTTHGDPQTYDLSERDRPAILDDDDPRHFLAIDVEYARLDDLADVTLPGIASGFGLAHHFLDGAAGSAAWDREGGLGQNPFPEFSSYLTEVQALISSTSWKVTASAEHMRQVVKDFRATDDWIAQAHRDLEQHTETVGTGPAH